MSKFICPQCQAVMEPLPTAEGMVHVCLICKHRLKPRGPKAVICPDCKTAMPLVTTGYGRQYACSTCDMVHGAHQKTGEPLGIPADKVTRQARMAAHAAFDPLWKSGRMSRRDAYKWLAGVLEIEIDKCHIGNFDLETCNKVSLLSIGKFYRD